jgi:hypothetical protein
VVVVVGAVVLEEEEEEEEGRRRVNGHHTERVREGERRRREREHKRSPHVPLSPIHLWSSFAPCPRSSAASFVCPFAVATISGDWPSS